MGKSHPEMGGGELHLPSGFLGWHPFRDPAGTLPPLTLPLSKPGSIRVPAGSIQAFDLAPPARLLGARIRCRDASCDIREMPLGAGEDAPKLVRYDRGACKAGCCEAYVTVDLHVPCDSLPHCHYCECGSDNRFTLGEDVLRELKGFLP